MKFGILFIFLKKKYFFLKIQDGQKINMADFLQENSRFFGSKTAQKLLKLLAVVKIQNGN
jgi:hypothetical protein